MACNLSLISSLFIASFIISSSSCPTLKTYHSIGLINPSNFTRQCPSFLVKSQSDCIQKFCDIRRNNHDGCLGDAVQFTVIGNTSICYILQYQSQINYCDSINHKESACRLEHDVRSTLYFVQHNPPSIGTEIRCAPTDLCENGECIPHTKCNGVTECSDHSDERGCEHQNFDKCDPEVYFKCHKDAQCIPLSLQCDGELFCSDGSDEMGCGEYLIQRNSDTMQITAIAGGTIVTLLLLVLLFACGQRVLSARHRGRAARLRNLRLGSSAADYVVRLLPGEQPFDDTLPPPYNESNSAPVEAPPIYEPLDLRDRLIDLAESSGFSSPNSQESSTKLEDITQNSDISEPGPSSSFDMTEELGASDHKAIE